MTECLAGCGTPLHPAAAEGGFAVHPGCEPREAVAGYRWGCVGCGMTGVADNATHAAALHRSHFAYACPSTAQTRQEFDLRVARRWPLTELYPDEVPPYDRPFRTA